MASDPRRRAAPSAPVEDTEEEDILELGTDVALAAFQGLVFSGLDPDKAVMECWKYPVKFLQARQAWFAAVQEAYEVDDD